MKKNLTVIFTLLFSVNALVGNTGKIAGRVIDAKSKEPLSGVSVLVVGTSMGTATNVDGNYSILNVPPGTYNVRATSVGYQSMQINDNRVSIDLTTEVDVALTESPITTDAVIVTAQRPMVQKDITSTTAIIGRKEIEVLPITSFQDVLSLQAGVVSGHFRGGRNGEVSFWIDGVPVTDAYDGSTVIDVNRNSIQEMQLVTGAFNAEYGKAMSGIINIATRSGGDQLRGSITAYGGGFVTSHADIFAGLQTSNPLGVQWLEGSLDGPIVKDKLSFFIDARYFYSGGHLYGIRKFNTYDITIARDPNPANWTIQQTGDNKAVQMAPYLEMYLQGKLTFKFSPEMQVSYSYFLDNSRGKNYNFALKYNPDGELSNFKKGYLNSITLTHTLSSTTFYTLGLSNYFRDYREYLDQKPFSLSDLFRRENPFNQRFVHTALFQAPEGTFVTGGTNMANNIHNTNTYVAKFDLTSQVSENHMIKAGLEFDYNKLFFHNINLQMSPVDVNRDPIVDGKPFLEGPVVIPGIESGNNLMYVHQPRQFAAYIQDKMEYKSLIVNFGVRFDWFHPDGQVLANPADPNVYIPLQPQYQDSAMAPGIADPTLQHELAVQKRMLFWYKNAKDKWQLSPRLGIAYPITERGIVHFSYGLFFQMPSFATMFANPGYKLQYAGSTNLGIIGNPDIDPEQTTSGELGLQQQLADDLSIDVTGFFRDIKNLAGTLNKIQYVFGGAAVYSEYQNTDFGFIKGIALSVTKRVSSSISGTLDYTFQIAKGDASDPASAFNLRNSGVLPETQLIPLDWDQRHTLNVTLNYGNVGNWGASFVFQFGSGTPYTPQQLSNSGQLVYNSAIKPSTYNLNARFYKDFQLSGESTLSLFLRINNVFDRKNTLNVYTDTGLPNVSLAEEQLLTTNPSQRIATVQDWYTNPTFYSEPRRVEFGTTISF